MSNGTEKEKVNGGAGKEKAKKPLVPPAAPKLRVSPKLSLLQDVIALMGEAQINEILFEQGGVKIHLRKGYGPPLEASMGSQGMQPPQAQPMPQLAPAQLPIAVPPGASAAGDDKTLTVTAPMVGTFYRSPAPDAKPFLQEGGRVEAGQVFCIIEAMKLMNEIKSEVSGKVVKILVQNGQAIEFGQPLLVVDPS